MAFNVPKTLIGHFITYTYSKVLSNSPLSIILYITVICSYGCSPQGGSKSQLPVTSLQPSSASGRGRPGPAGCPSPWKVPARRRSPSRTARMDPAVWPTWSRSLVRATHCRRKEGKKCLKLVG